MNPIPTHSHRKATEEAAFQAWQAANGAMFHLMLAYKYGSPDTAADARRYLAQAVAALDAVAVDSVTFEGAAV